MPLSIAQPAGGVMSSLDAGAVTSGSVNQMITDSGPLGANNGEPATYIVDISTYQTGTQDTNNSNMLLNIGGANGGGIITGGVTIGKLLSGAVLALARVRVTVTNGQHVYVTVGNTAPGAGSVYNAQMQVTRSLNRYGDV